VRPLRNIFYKLSRTEQRREGVAAYLCTRLILFSIVLLLHTVSSFSDASEFFTGGRMFVKTGQKLFVRVYENPRGVRICKRLWSPGIDSEESISPAYVAWRASTTNRVIVPARQAGNRFLGSF
jgi:hypothetical protein